MKTIDNLMGIIPLACLLGIGSIVGKTYYEIRRGTPVLEQIKDLTGDGILDVIVHDKQHTWLYIGKKEGGFIRGERRESKDGPQYFVTPDKKAYFFDGQFYRQSIQQK